MAIDSSPSGTDPYIYLAALLDAKGGVCINQTNYNIYLNLEFKEDTIPEYLVSTIGGKAKGRDWRITRRSELRRALEGVLPHMQVPHRRERVELAARWAELASFRRPGDPERERAWDALV